MEIKDLYKNVDVVVITSSFFISYLSPKDCCCLPMANALSGLNKWESENIMKKYFKILFLFLLIPGLCYAQTFSGKVVKINGEVLKNGTTLKINDVLNEKDIIKTDDNKNSYIDIKFANGNYFRLKNGKIKLIKLKKNFKIELFNGSVYVNVDKKKLRKKFKIMTPSAIVGVRGTKFFTEYTTGKDKTYICVCEGTVRAKKNGLLKKIFGKKIDIKSGQDGYIIRKEKISAPKESPGMVKMTVMEFKDMGF